MLRDFPGKDAYTLIAVSFLSGRLFIISMYFRFIASQSPADRRSIDRCRAAICFPSSRRAAFYDVQMSGATALHGFRFELRRGISFYREGLGFSLSARYE